MSIEALMPMLVCPVSRGQLEWLPAEQLLFSALAGIAYPVRDGVPVLLVEEAIIWPPDNEKAASGG